jgi:hypothetical protein
VNHLVLSGTATLVPSGTQSSCYRGPKSNITFWRFNSFRARNFTNLESYGFPLTGRAFFAVVDGRCFANWGQRSRIDYLLQKPDSQFRSRIINRLAKNPTPQRPRFSESYSNSNIGGKAALAPQLACISTRRLREGRAA